MPINGRAYDFESIEAMGPGGLIGVLHRGGEQSPSDRKAVVIPFPPGGLAPR